MKRFGIIVFFILLSLRAAAQVTFVIESLPSATQASDTIFIAGTFNNWTTNDPKFAMQRQLNGQLALTINATGPHQFKFTRGSWTKVETNKSNRYTENRSIVFDGKKTVYFVIENWLDLGGAKELNYWIFYFFAIAFQGVALCLLVYRSQRKDALKFKKFLLFNGVAIVLLIALVVHQTTNQIWQSYLTFFFHIVLFCWAPLALYFIDSVSAGNFKLRTLHFFPATIVSLFTIIRILNVNALAFLHGDFIPTLSATNAAIAIAGSLFNSVCYWQYYRNNKTVLLHPGDQSKSRFSTSLFWSSCLPLLFIPLNIALLVAGAGSNFFEDFQLVAITLSGLVFIETYFFWKHPELLREEKQVAPLPDGLSEIARRLDELMVTDKPFKKVDLNITELADLLQTKPHNLSRIINDYHQKNFRDFVNSFRIREFIALANSKEFKHYTFLALAQEVGFNSKSTFNLAFKKQTNLSPREYFRKSMETSASEID